ncbi:isochorismatase family protein, partial [Mesorhizobium sp. M1D.F.Ca.ET.184.01.1.1]|uniref:isochorismatase family protein n=1 Tax=Mesorhizobium sp. M1D.F.Ca.ET.184.01.1.1 TaxID=2563931 RepID=UPI0010931E50
SSASSLPGKQAFETIEMPYGPQNLLPDHYIQGTPGCDLHFGLAWTKAELVIRKGFRAAIDSYSAFFENDHTTPTGLGGYLKERGIDTITLVGLATDFCVAFSALDAAKQDFKTTVRLDACRGIDLNGSVEAMLKRMREAGVTL